MSDKLNNFLKEISGKKTICINNNINLHEIKTDSSNPSLSTENSHKNQKNNNLNIEKCKICNETNDLIKCPKCKNNYHSKCINLNGNISNFLCSNCSQKKPFSVSSNIKSNEKKEKKEIFKSTNNKIGNKRKRGKVKSKNNKKTIEEKNINKINKEINNINNIKKRKKTTIIDLLKKDLLSNYEQSAEYKRRKIKIGLDHQIDIYEYKEKYENEINFDEEEYERNQLKQVWSVSKNPFSKEEIDKYLKTARLFWNYRNLNIENELCGDYFEECEKIMKKKLLSDKLKKKINKLMKELKELIRRGVDLNCHYDEICLKMLFLCNFKMKVALLFLYKQLNPFIEEIIEGFKSDVLIFQNELFSMINEGDFYPDD